MKDLDIAKNRAATKWSVRENALRVIWGFAKPLFLLSPRPLWFLRNALLRAFGARIGSHVHIYPTVRITMPWNLEIGDYTAIGDKAIIYALGPVRIGERATVSQYAHLCAGTHDIQRRDRPLVKTPITIGNDVWIAADAFIGAGVDVGAGAIVGARAVVMKRVPPGLIVAGNPAREIRSVPISNVSSSQ